MTNTFMTRAIDEAELQALAADMAGQLAAPMIIYLEGDLGAGKTTFTRALLRGLGFKGPVKSPTYGLLEVYALQDIDVVHLDLYRIAETGELEFLGLDDLHSKRAVFMVEWPDRGAGRLPDPDLTISFEHAADLRKLALTPHSIHAKEFCKALSSTLNSYSS